LHKRPYPFAHKAHYPAKPVRFVVVTAPGGGLDVVGRIVADRLSRSLRQTVIVENRPGAGGNIACE
jgi:tripartite-type tricarboxylate transporter receptor subunit TctC